VAVTAVRTGDVVVIPQGLTAPHGYRLLPDIKVGQAGHTSRRIKLVYLLFKQANSDHLAI